jgi:hypothetical protein
VATSLPEECSPYATIHIRTIKFGDTGRTLRTHPQGTASRLASKDE